MINSVSGHQRFIFALLATGLGMMATTTGVIYAVTPGTPVVTVDEGTVEFINCKFGEDITASNKLLYATTGTFNGDIPDCNLMVNQVDLHNLEVDDGGIRVSADSPEGARVNFYTHSGDRFQHSFTPVAHIPGRDEDPYFTMDDHLNVNHFSLLNTDRISFGNEYLDIDARGNLIYGNATGQYKVQLTPLN